MARPKSIQYRSVTVEKFWQMVDAGFAPPAYCFLIMADGTQSWGYPMTKWRMFDHHRQGATHRQEVAHVVLSVDSLKEYKASHAG